MRVFVTGASGLIGNEVCSALLERGDEVVGLSRSTRPDEGRMRWVKGDQSNLREWQNQVSGCDAIVNLAGETIAKRWTRRQMEAIVTSRVGITTALYHAIRNAKQPPSTVVSASGVNYYGTDPEIVFDEESPKGFGFLANVCQEWETAAERCTSLGARVVRARIGVVLSGSGGALPILARPIKAFVGGALGTGQQWVSWIHIRDLTNILLRLLDAAEVHGAFNAVAPEPVRQRELVSAIGKALHRPVWLDAPGFALRLMLGRMARETLLEGQRVIPRRAQKLDLDFSFPNVGRAVADALRRW